MSMESPTALYALAGISHHMNQDPICNLTTLLSCFNPKGKAREGETPDAVRTNRRVPGADTLLQHAQGWPWAFLLGLELEWPSPELPGEGS